MLNTSKYNLLRTVSSILISALMLIASQAKCQTTEFIVFEDITGCDYEVSDESITKTASAGWSNAGAYSVNCLRSNVDGLLVIYDPPVTGKFSLGLSFRFSGFDNNNIDHALEFDNGQVSVVEGGTVVTSYGPFSSGDNFTVERTGTTMTYYINGIPITSTTCATTEMHVDIAIYDVGVALKDILVDFKPCIPTTGDNYCTPLRELSDAYYLTHDGHLKFKFDEEYFMGEISKLSYNIYNSTLTTVASVNYSGTPTSGAPNPIVVEGDNRFDFDLTGLGLTNMSFYTLEIVNKKNEKRYLYFKYQTP